MNIWAKWQNGKVEKVDECSPKDAAYLVREYKMAYRSWAVKVWAGRKKDEPNGVNT